MALVGALASLGPALCGSAVAHAVGPVGSTGKGITGGALLGAELVILPLGIAGVEPWWAYALGGGLGAAGGAVGGYYAEQTATAEPSMYMLAGGLALAIPAVVVMLNATAYQVEVEDGEADVTVEGVGAGAAGESVPEGASGPASTPGVTDPAATPAPDPRTEAPEARRSPGSSRSGCAAGSSRSGCAAGSSRSGCAAGSSRSRCAAGSSRSPYAVGRPYLPMSLVGVDLAAARAVVRPGIPSVAIAPLHSEEEIGLFGAESATLVSVPFVSGRF
ncbi:MAG: hypothetical protein EXR75_00975 [Myxococcales bacterium]|nr:hypothetical protein [Myxococcales bacterium]